MRYSISNAIPHNPKSEKHPYENLVNQEFIVVLLIRIIVIIGAILLNRKIKSTK